MNQLRHKGSRLVRMGHAKPRPGYPCRSDIARNFEEISSPKNSKDDALEKGEKSEVMTVPITDEW
jgi:hypothetical protein